jgi:hypothetical protein
MMAASVEKRVFEKKIESGKTWDEITKEAKIPLKSWMTGLPISHPTDTELKKLAPVLNTTYKWLKYGKE